MKKFIFSEEEKKSIEQAVAEAEKKTSGEIVPYFIDFADEYKDAAWKGACWFAGITLLIISSLAISWNLSVPVTAIEITAATFIMGIFGFVISRYYDPLKKFFASESTMEQRVEQAAERIFLEQEVFKTRDRTGILILVSYFEHEVVVLGDTGINAKVKKEDWIDIVNTIVSHIKKGKPAEGLVLGIGQCGALLHKAGVEIKPDDTNELSNKLRNV